MKNKSYSLFSPEPISSIKELMEKAVQEAGDKTAFRFRQGKQDCSVTFREFEQQTCFLGTALAGLGLKEDHIAILSENRYEWICCYLTVLKSSGVFVPIDKELPVGDIINVINDSESKAVFYSGKYEQALMEHADQLPQIRYFIGIDREENSSDGKFLSYRLLMEQGEKRYLEGDRSYTEQTSDPQKMKLLVYTSGTTGMAKGVMLSEHNLVSSVYYGLQVSTIYDRGLSVLPYNHTYEAVSGILVSLHHHSTVCINDSLKNIAKNMVYYQPDYIYLVPAFVELFYKKIWANAKKTGAEGKLRLMIKVSNGLRKIGIDLRRTFFSSIHSVFGGHLRKLVCGGAPIRPELGEFFDAIGISLTNGYGITECSPLVSVNRDDFNDCSTVGIPLPCCQIKIQDPDEDGIGEICVKGDVVMLGYFKKPEQTAQVLTPDGWFSTGDYGTINEKGQLVITGRKKNLIVLDNGKNIFPEEIENLISAIDYVTEVVVYGHQNQAGLEDALYAEIYCSPEALAASGVTDPQQQLKQDIAAACHELPSYKRISKIILREQEFEKTTTNKIKRNTVVKQ